MKQCCVPGCVEVSLPSRRYCNDHYQERHRQQARARHALHGRYTYLLVCNRCKKQFVGSRNNQQFCSNCYHAIRQTLQSHINPYVPAGGDGYCWEHRRIAERQLGISLGENLVVHHRDCNPKNNLLENLIIMNRDDHGKLHHHIYQILVQSVCTDSLDTITSDELAFFTDDWILSNNVPVILLVSWTDYI